MEKTKTITGMLAAAVTLFVGAAAAAPAERIELLPASELVGLEVRSEDGREAGEIESVLITGASGRVRYVLVSGGGELTLADDEIIPLPFGRLDVRATQGNEITAEADLELLQGARRIKKNDVGAFSQPLLVAEIFDYYGVPAEERDQETPAGASGDDSQRPSRPDVLIGRNVVATISPGMTKTGDLLGADVVRGVNDEELGEIDQVVLNADDGSVAYVLIAQGGFLGIGEKWYPVPIESLMWDREREAYQALVPSGAQGGEFESLPKGELPRSVRRDELRAFYDAFNVRTGT